MSRLLGVTPAVVAHDLHPDYRSTRWALASGLPRVAVQHHHAHVVSCLVEHGVVRPDRRSASRSTGRAAVRRGMSGAGSSSSSTGWAFERRGHLRPLALPGGEAAIREPWRLAAGALLDAGLPEQLLVAVGSAPARASGAAPRRSGPRATGAGRWFDAVAALCGFSGSISYEGQAAIELEALAAAAARALSVRAREGDAVRGRSPPDHPGAWRRTSCQDARCPRWPARFHETMARVVASACPAHPRGLWRPHGGTVRWLLSEPPTDGAGAGAAPGGWLRGSAPSAGSTERRRRLARASGGRRSPARRERTAMCLGIPGEILAHRRGAGRCGWARCASAASRGTFASTTIPDVERGRLRPGPRRVRHLQGRSRGGGEAPDRTLEELGLPAELTADVEDRPP